MTHFLLKFVQRERHRLTRHLYSAELQTAKQTLTTLKDSIEFTYNDFLCHFKANRDKVGLINRRWKCKMSKKSTVIANSFTKIDQLDRGGKSPLWQIPSALGTNQIAVFFQFRPFTS